MDNNMWCNPNFFFMSFIVILIPIVTKGDLELRAIPGEHIKEGTSLQLTCVLRPNSQDHAHTLPDASQETEVNPKCHFRWNRSYYPASRMSGIEAIASSGKELYFYTSRDSKGAAFKSTVTILEMSPHFEGTYTCYLDCPERSESASIKLQLSHTGSIFADQGAIIASIVAFVVIGVVLLVVGIKAFKESCCLRPHRNPNSPCNSLISSQTSNGGEYMDPPPRYSVVVLASETENKTNCQLNSVQSQKYLADRVAGKLGRTTSVESVVLLQPPDYEQAIKDLAIKGIHFDLNDLTPMPPAYNEMPYIVDVKTPPPTPPAGANGDSKDELHTPSILRMSSVEL